MNINKTIEKVSKRNLVHSQDITFRYKGKRHCLRLYRHYENKSVSICNPANCNAGKGCCHYVRTDGIGLCCSLGSYFELRLKRELSHTVASFVDSDLEGKLINFAQNILDIITGEREAELIDPDKAETMLA